MTAQSTMEETIKWAVDALDSPMDRALISDRLKEALQAAPSRGPDAVSVNLADAREFCEGAFGPFGVDIEPYVKIIAELMARAALRSVPDGAAKVIAECEQAAFNAYSEFAVDHDRYVMEGPAGMARAMINAIRTLSPTDETSACPSPAATDDEDHPDCHTKRERELYFALMGLTSAVMTRRREWENWKQGGVIIAPIVRKALRLDASMQEDGK